jgi:channel protein (hemolysin III family)
MGLGDVPALLRAVRHPLRCPPRLGGIFYTVGAGVFATKWPNPSPKWFGFHEVFHSFTLGGWAAHFVAATLVVTAVR